MFSGRRKKRDEENDDDDKKQQPSLIEPQSAMMENFSSPPPPALDTSSTMQKNERGNGKKNHVIPTPAGAELHPSTAVDADGTTTIVTPNHTGTLIIPPGFLMFGISVPMFARAYVLYHRPLESLWEKIAKRNNISINDITKDADIGVRRAAGMVVAGRGLSVATYLSFGCFGLLGGTIFFAMGWDTIEEGINATRKWGNSKRKKIDKLLGVETKRVDQDHPDVIARSQMTRQEESEYLANRYWRIKPPREQRPEEAGGGGGNNPKQ